MSGLGEFFTQRTNDHVPNMSYAADVRYGGQGRVTIPALAAADPNGILAAQSVTSAGSATSFAATYTGSEAQMGRFGRNITAVASGADTDALVIKGKDYLGQYMSETLTLNGTTPVVGKKAFRWIDEIVWLDQAGITIDVGWGDVLGLPYKVIDLELELVDGAVPGSAGAVVAGLATGTAATATNADTRGTYAPHSSQVPDGSKVYTLTCHFDDANLHGNVQFFA